MALGLRVVIGEGAAARDVGDVLVRPLNAWRGKRLEGQYCTAGSLYGTFYNRPVRGLRSYSQGGELDGITRGTLVQLLLGIRTSETTVTYNGDRITRNGVTVVYGEGIPIWTGHIDEMKHSIEDGYQEYRLSAFGLIATLTDLDISVATQASITVPNALAMLRAAHIAAGGAPAEIELDDDLTTETLTNWEVDDQTHLSAIRDIEDATGALLVEQPGLKLRLQSSARRMALRPAPRFNRELLAPVGRLRLETATWAKLPRTISGQGNILRRGFIELSDVVEYGFAQLGADVTQLSRNGTVVQYNGVIPGYGGPAQWFVEAVRYTVSGQSLVDQELSVSRV